jgi:manganese/iron transport system substrate-binding protein
MRTIIIIAIRCSSSMLTSIRPKPLFLLMLSLSLSACTPEQPPEPAGSLPDRGRVKTAQLHPAGTPPKIIATTSVLCDLTRQIAANTIDLTCLGIPGTDPHIYEPTPADRRAIVEANLILYSGYGFEPKLIKLIQATPAIPQVAVAETAVPQARQAADPHVWNSAQNAAKMVTVIQQRLAQVNPSSAPLYTQNAQRLTREIGQLDTWIKAQVATIPAASRTLITTHDALGYYAAAYDIPVEGALQGISTEAKPTAQRLRAIVTTIQTKRVPTIFAELTVNPQVITQVAREARVKVADLPLFADGLGEPGSGGETYQTMMVSNTQTIVTGLGGSFTPFVPQ